MEAFTIIIEDGQDGPAVTVQQSYKLVKGKPPTPARRLFNFLMGGMAALKARQDELVKGALDPLRPRLYNAEGDEIEMKDLHQMDGEDG